MAKSYRSKLIYPLAAALLATFGCNKEEDLAPAATLSQSTASALQDGSVNPSVRFRANNYIIISASNALPADLESQVAALKGNVTGNLKEVGIAMATSSDANFAAKAAKISGVQSVIRDVNIQWFDPQNTKTVSADAIIGSPASTGDDDPYALFQWGLTAIHAPEAWNAGARGKGVRVAVLDTGFDLKHPDLAANIDQNAARSFVPGESVQFNPAIGDFSHGTHTAGTIAAVDNNIGVIGVAPDAQLVLVKVLSDKGSGNFSWMIQGILYAVQQGADVINMSLGAGLPRNGKFLDDNGTPDDPSDDFVVSDTKATQELINAISKVTTYATQHGTTVIASAGNDANNGNKDGSLMYIPAGAPNVISISATAPEAWVYNPLTTDLDGVASYTNYGTSDVTFAAPGGDFRYPGNEASKYGIPVWALDMVISTVPGGYSWSAGTSMAAPHAAGIAALIIGQHGGQMNPAQVEAAMRASADDLGKPGRDPYYGFGRLNAFKAVTAVQ
ncbi:S8 family peptidase [Pontibacter chitinilyticus]|uniref:S8 family peptidase n=1 Tax=Pontibacter chitinilyticus TaxID=2674989 RepID=UPI0032196F0F